jgi:predicted nucleic acid-binding protein
MDRGIILNLCATGCVVEILETLPYRSIILDDICQSPLFLWTSTPEDEELLAREEISITSLISAGVLEVEQFEKERYRQTYVAFASQIQDRQAALLTLAEQHSATLAIDDKRARKVLRHLAPYVPVFSTLACLNTWQTNRQLTNTDMRAILRNVADKAQFIPPDDDALFAWWQQLVR